MISFLNALAAGNAVSLILAPPQGARRWSVLRKPSDDISGINDAGATLVYSGSEKYIVDVTGLYNGSAYFYQPFYFDGTTWTTAASASVTPQCSFEFIDCDVLTFVRDRIALGLQAAVEREALFPSSGSIPVLTAAPTEENVSFPVVTVHLQLNASADRAIGEVIGMDEQVDANDVMSFDGWLERHQLALGVWCLNSDERIAVRNVVKAIVLSNLQVFDAAGMQQIDLQFVDQEDFETYNAPMYQAIGTISCIAPAAIGITAPAIQVITAQNAF
ncbi:hypothetical protein [Burkholderia sp. Ac-20349]|uniref:hypothetical protein n=1 Tax=Burkholderia sp. Ac-20349 TaxID=2703893 RepID=UPI00197BBD10|nr:hypothetical protein [Burkholderia sp. Ac-20349]MBN3839282.1 hypothetical protein [Burkholderia sp. Ac-20349]